MTTPETLTFPCSYPIKVVMRADAPLRAAVDAVFERHANAAVVATAITRRSAQGNFSGVTYTLEARDVQHIAALFADLKEIPGVLMVL